MKANPNRITHVDLLGEFDPSRHVLEKCFYEDHVDHLDRQKWCDAESPNGGWACTRPVGHSGWHECHFQSGLVYARWRDDDAGES